MLKYITKYLIKWAESKNRVLKITGTSDFDDVYLVRYYIIKSKWFCFYIHQFLRSDRDDLHDHPWNFVTYIINGSYTEELRRSNEELGSILFRTSNQSFKKRWNSRKATDLHKIEIDRIYNYSERHLAPTTLFFCGPKKREWGFVDSNTGNWIYWKKYLNLPDNTPDRG